MTDGPGRRVLKAIALGHFYLNVWTHRALQRVRGRRSHLLVGECRRCARCCEAPSVRANAAVWYLKSLRGLFLGWMKHVNGFELDTADRASRTFVFRCTHFDWETRSCDSYVSRPGMCRDYPRARWTSRGPRSLWSAATGSGRPTPGPLRRRSTASPSRPTSGRNCAVSWTSNRRQTLPRVLFSRLRKLFSC